MPDPFPSAASPPPLTGPPARRCADCGALLAGRYCAACGQEDRPLRVPLGQLARESFVEVFGVDGRLWRTLGALLFRPGRLTRAYLEGHRSRYLRPLRIYLTAALAFFFLLALLDPASKLREIGREEAEPDSLVRVEDRLARVEVLLADSLALDRTRQGARRADEVARELGPDVLGVLPSEGPPTAEVVRAGVDTAATAAVSRETRRLRQRLEVERALLRALPPADTISTARIARAARLAATQPAERDIVVMPGMEGGATVQRLRAAESRAELFAALADLGRGALGYVPTLMFVLLPVFALLLKFLYVRRDRYYTEHAVFALHVHAFAFVCFALIAALVAVAPGAGWAGPVLTGLWLAVPVYFLAAMKVVYGQGWMRTLVKAVVLGWAYGLVLLLGLTGALVLAALFV